MNWSKITKYGSLQVQRTSPLEETSQHIEYLANGSNGPVAQMWRPRPCDKLLRTTVPFFRRATIIRDIEVDLGKLDGQVARPYFIDAAEAMIGQEWSCAEAGGLISAPTVCSPPFGSHRGGQKRRVAILRTSPSLCRCPDAKGLMARRRSGSGTGSDIAPLPKARRYRTFSTKLRSDLARRLDAAEKVRGQPQRLGRPNSGVPSPLQSSPRLPARNPSRVPA